MQFNDGTYWEDSNIDTLPILSIEAIAHSLSRICRYGGHVSQYLSVAQHSVAIAKLCSPENVLEALLHDASEAYVGDIPAPMKWQNPHMQAFEEKIQERIFEHYCLKWPIPDEVEYFDKAITYTEMTTFFDYLSPMVEATVKQKQGDKLFSVPEYGKSWMPQEAKQNFIEAWYNEIHGSTDLWEDLNDA